jgi:hypothetical protein
MLAVLFSVIAVLLFAPSTAFAADDSQASLYVPDGQLLSIPVKVYVSSVNLDLIAKPRLQLAGFKAHDRTTVTELKKWEPFLATPNQSWTEKVEGQNVTRRGTLLMFDLNQLKLDWYKSTMRVAPILTWEPADPQPSNGTELVGNWVYLGSRCNAAFWTVIAIGLLVGIIWRMARVHKKSVLHLISGLDGYMSLWRTQLAVWTLAVGSMVFLFGIIQLDVPRIPESLVVLMGMAVATGSLSAIAGKTDHPSPDTAPEQTNPATPDPTPASSAAKRTPAPKPLWSHLISTFNSETRQVGLSVAKAQMVFWTGVIVVLFVVKSLLSGELWAVPWELVTLTGVSQAGYVGDKALQGKK